MASHSHVNVAYKLPVAIWQRLAFFKCFKDHKQPSSPYTRLRNFNSYYPTHEGISSNTLMTRIQCTCTPVWRLLWCNKPWYYVKMSCILINVYEITNMSFIIHPNMISWISPNKHLRHMKASIRHIWNNLTNRAHRVSSKNIIFM